MPERNKYRLYITLQHRHEKRGYHWALMLGPKLESSASQATKDSHLFHLTNAITPGHPQSGKWRYENELCNQMGSGRLVARFLLAKLPASRPMASWVDNIHSTATRIKFDQKTTNCRLWMQDIVAALQQKPNQAYHTIPRITQEVRHMIEGDGDNAMATIISGTKALNSAGDLPNWDIRVRPGT